MKKSNFALRLQPSLMEEARRVAKAEGVAMNQLINVAVAEKVSALRTEEYFAERAARGNEQTSRATTPVGSRVGRRRDALGALLLASPALAQEATGTILGNVKDTAGAMVPTAQVTATNVGTQFSRTATTDASGQYALRLLPVGHYRLEVTMTGFKGFSQTGIVLEVAATPASTPPSSPAASPRASPSSPTRPWSTPARPRCREPWARTRS